MKKLLTQGAHLALLLFFLISVPLSADSSKVERFQQNIQFQLYSSSGLPVDGTQFWTTVTVIKEDRDVTIQFPEINFFVVPDPTSPSPGGFLISVDGFLPKSVRPISLISGSALAASNTGVVTSFSYNQPPPAFANPLPGYIVQIDESGMVLIQAAGTFNNIIPVGVQIFLPTSVSYTTKPKQRLCKNIVLSNGATNVTSFDPHFQGGNVVRDLHINDAFAGKVGWSWIDDSMIVDKSRAITNVMVSIGKNDNHGKLKVHPPIQLTDLPDGMIIFDTCVGINRTDSDNFVVSYGAVPPKIPDCTLTFGGHTYRARGGANFGSQFTINAQIVAAQPLNADTPLTNNLTNKIALIAADGFNTGSANKANNAFAAGAIGVIIFNDFNNLINIGGSGDIPTIIIDKDVGLALLSAQPISGTIQSLPTYPSQVLNTMPCRAVSFDGGKTFPAFPGDTTTTPYKYTSFFGGITNANPVSGIANFHIDDLQFGNLGVENLTVNQILYTIDAPAPGIAQGTIVTINTYDPVTMTGTLSFFPTSAAVNIPDLTLFTASPPLNGLLPINTSVSDGFRDLVGAKSDKFGNFWYCTTNGNDEFGNFINQPIFSVSTDKGRTFQAPSFTAPLPDNIGEDSYDFPQFCFSGDGSDYGLRFIIDYFTVEGDGSPVVGFFTVNPDGTIGTPTPVIHLDQFTNSCTATGTITASLDDRVWFLGRSAAFNPFIDVTPGPTSVIFKSPGNIDENYVGPWPYSGLHIADYFPVPTISQPVVGFLIRQPTTVIFDNARQALYATYTFQGPNTQNMDTHFVISRDNGQTWSAPILINTTSFANRGFESMALDETTGNLIFGWYDGRHDPAYESLEYLAAILPAKVLDRLVNKIPLSNPLFAIPAAGSPQPIKMDKLGLKKSDKKIRNRKRQSISANATL